MASWYANIMRAVGQQAGVPAKEPLPSSWGQIQSRLQQARQATQRPTQVQPLPVVTPVQPKAMAPAQPGPPSYTAPWLPAPGPKPMPPVQPGPPTYKLPWLPASGAPASGIPAPLPYQQALNVQAPGLIARQRDDEIKKASVIQAPVAAVAPPSVAPKPTGMIQQAQAPIQMPKPAPLVMQAPKQITPIAPPKPFNLYAPL